MQGHTAYGILSVVDKLPLKIESIDVWGMILMNREWEGGGLF